MYRFFDVNFNNKITFNEFSKTLEALNLKIAVKDQLKIFKFLDNNSKGYINYQDFCNLSDERRRKIDPIALIKGGSDAASNASGVRGPNYNALSPENREKARLRSKPNGAPKDLNELEAYLK